MQIKEIFKEIGGVLSKNNIVDYDLRLYKYYSFFIVHFFKKEWN